jgi:uncharacterized protein YbjT (DUF2867 family)
MRIAVIGASGRTGRAVMTEAARRGHDTRAVVRSAARADEGWAIAVADGRDVDALARALEGRDVAVFCVGPVPADDDPAVMRESAAATLEAARRAGVPRLVFVSASGPYTDGDDAFTRGVVKPILGVFLRKAFADLTATELVVRASDADWTLVRPPMLTNAAGRGAYRSNRAGSVRGGIRIARADLARALVDAAEATDASRATVSVAQ